MTKKELAEIKKIILKSLSELDQSNSYLDEATKPIEPSVAIGRLSRMEAIGEKSVNEAMHLNVKRRIEKLKNALDRITKGTYGICLRCKKEIAMGRLKAVPESMICITCAEKK